MWLTFKLFGNGSGIGAPFWDQEFYWLVDTHRKGRSAKNGRFYTWMSGLGAQLHSYEWFMPKPGTRRRLGGQDFFVFNASRHWFKVRIGWSIYGGARDFAHVREIKDNLMKSMD